MKYCLHQSTILFTLTVILGIVVRFPAISSQRSPAYDVCGKSFMCGDIPLEYPFWGSRRPAYCGYPGFQLECDNNFAQFEYELVNYRVLDTNNSTQSLTLARDDLRSDFCTPLFYKTSFNTALFNVDNSGQENVSLYYECKNITTDDDHKFFCSGIGSERDGYFSMTNLTVSNTTSYLGQCNFSITVPVSKSMAGRLASPFATITDLRLALMTGFSVRWIAKNSECDICTRSKGRCGSNETSPELFVCYCDTGNFSLTCNNKDGSRGSNGALWKLIIIGCSCGIAVIIIILVIIFYQRKRLLDSQKAANHHIETFIRNYGNLSPKRYKYSEIKIITNSFTKKLGQGGYGSVYKGQLPNGHLVAVKLLDGVKGNGEDFINEVGSIGRTYHVNIVTLLGYCLEGKKRALVYEFMPNGSLDKFVRHGGSRLDWNTLFQIATGIARGLEYLHRGCDTSIVHFDIKPHNILLDEEFVPKISDFGLAKLCKSKECVVSVTGARGTAGYIAPKVFFRGLRGPSHKSDVYSYGMMVLEMTGTRKDDSASTTDMSATYFPDTVYKKVEAGGNLGVDGVTTAEEEKLARKMVMVSLWCIQSDPVDRPSISKVVEMLDGSFESLQVPPKRFWSSSTTFSQITSLSATLSSSDEIVPFTMPALRED